MPYTGTFVTWMIHKITVAPMGGVDEAGQPIFGKKKTVKCFVMERDQEIVNAQGQQVMSSAEIFTFEEIGEQDWLWLPGRDTNDDSQGNTPHKRLKRSNKYGTLQYWVIYM